MFMDRMKIKDRVAFKEDVIFMGAQSLLMPGIARCLALLDARY